MTQPLSRSPSPSQPDEESEQDILSLVDILGDAFADEIARNAHLKSADTLVKLDLSGEGVVRCNLDCLEVESNFKFLDQCVSLFETRIPRCWKLREALKRMDESGKVSNLTSTAARQQFYQTEAEKMHYFLEYGTRLLKTPDRFSKSVKLHSLRLIHRHIFLGPAGGAEDPSGIPCSQPRLPSDDGAHDADNAVAASPQSSKSDQSTDTDASSVSEKSASEELEMAEVVDSEPELEEVLEDDAAVYDLEEPGEDDLSSPDDAGVANAGVAKYTALKVDSASPLSVPPFVAEAARHPLMSDDFMPDTEGAKNRRRKASCKAKHDSKLLSDVGDEAHVHPARLSLKQLPPAARASTAEAAAVPKGRGRGRGKGRSNTQADETTELPHVHGAAGVSKGRGRSKAKGGSKTQAAGVAMGRGQGRGKGGSEPKASDARGTAAIPKSRGKGRGKDGSETKASDACGDAPIPKSRSQGRGKGYDTKVEAEKWLHDEAEEKMAAERELRGSNHHMQNSLQRKQRQKRGE